MRYNRFDAHFLHPLQLPFRPDERIGAFPGFERAISFEIKAAMAVVPNMACSRVQHRLQHLLVVILRNKDDQLV
ncbi:hypothetical protein D3C76_1856620 [compost metagenome]